MKLSKNIKKFIVFCWMIGQISFLYAIPLNQIVQIKGFEENPILGYGLVVGLKGTGDSKKNPQSAEMLASIAENFGFYLDPTSVSPKNTAVVLVSAELSAFTSPGQKIDVTVSSVYDAKSLEGGELIVTPLLGGDNTVYAVASGSLRADKKSLTAKIPFGAIVQKSSPTPTLNTNQIVLLLKNGYSLRSLSPVVDAINRKWQKSVLSAEHNQIRVQIPKNTHPVKFIDELLGLEVSLPQEPRITIDSKNAFLIAGGNIMIDEALVSFDGTKIQIQNTSPWGNSGENSSLVKKIPSTTSLDDLVNALNAIGAGPSDIIHLIELLHKNGNLKANLIIQ